MYYYKNLCWINVYTIHTLQKWLSWLFDKYDANVGNQLA